MRRVASTIARMTFQFRRDARQRIRGGTGHLRPFRAPTPQLSLTRNDCSLGTAAADGRRRDRTFVDSRDDSAVLALERELESALIDLDRMRRLARRLPPASRERGVAERE